jgi:hypothetical protein
MQELVFDDLFSRTFGYLRQDGFRLNRDSALTALKLIEELLVAGTPDSMMERVIDELPRRLELSDPEVPIQCPPVNRCSIRYGDR